MSLAEFASADANKTKYVFSEDMRLGKYTLELRNLGQAEGAHKVGANARSSQIRRSGNR